MSNKKNLNESTVRRFWKLAGLRPINETPSYIQEEEEELEEVASKDKDEVVETEHMKRDDEVDEMAKMKRDDEVDEMAKMKRDDDLEEQLEEEDAMREPLDLDTEEAPGDEPDLDVGDVDAEVSVPESDVEALRAARNVIDQILSAADGADAEDEMDPEAPIEDEEMGLSDEEPEMAMEEENSSLDEDALDEMIESITSKVTKRLVKEALIKKLTK